jgi:hypothetical protein
MMKHEQPDNSRYTDLLDQSSDSSQTRLVHNLTTLYSVQLPPTLSWAEIEKKHRECHHVQKKEIGMQQRAVAAKKVRLTSSLLLRPSRRLGIAAALTLIVMLLSAAAAAALITPQLRGLFNQFPPTQRILQANQFSELHQSQTVGGATVQLEAAYADSNLLVVGYSISAPSADTYVEFTAVTQQGLTLPEFTGGGSDLNATNAPYFTAFNTSDITSPQQQLTFQLSGPVTQGTLSQAKLGHKSKMLGHVSFTISVPLHMGKILTPHQSVTINGQTATLERVVITPTLTSIFVSGLVKSTIVNGYSTLPSGTSEYATLDVQNRSHNARDGSPDDTQKNGTWVFQYTDNLYHSSGTWKLTIGQRVDSNQLIPTIWTFQFSVR